MHPQYRLLTTEELQSLEKEFIEYLVLNGITADDWVKLKENNINAAEDIITLFSDVVFEGILRKAKFIEKRDTHHLHIYQCLEEKLVLVAMEADPEEPVNFNDPLFIQYAAATPPASLKIFTKSKLYSKKREIELFEMLNSGGIITDDKLFKALCLSLG